MGERKYTVLDHVFYGATIVLWTWAICMIFMGIWFDPRWALTGVFCAALSFITASVPGWMRS